ncbi:IS630 family transposase [Aurantimonas sp. A2-1-M11]|uniref:IS630 family transposase n=1 Tax=Aurantimonas sp. A2-1-M11 TaxID=3113712 RepID=UPI003FA60DB0
MALWYQDEARVGQKGRLCHRWWTRGKRPPGLCDQRFDWTYIFGAVEPSTGQSFALVLPYADKAMMNLYLAEFAHTIPDDVHPVMVLDGAGWHGEKALDVPANITLVALPPYSPQLNPVERLWLYLRETSLSLCVFRDRQAIIDAQSPTQPGRAALALSARDLPQPVRLPRQASHHRRMLRCLEPRHQRSEPHPIPLQLSLYQSGQFMSGSVSVLFHPKHWV